MKLTWACAIVTVIVFIGSIQGEDNPGFFLKVAKNVPRLGKRNNFFIKQGTKNVPRLGRRSSFSSNDIEALKNYTHVQPFDSKFILDFLSDEVFTGNKDLKFIAWSDFDRMLEKEPYLKKKLASIARDKEIEDLKNLISKPDDDSNSVYGRPNSYANQIPKTYQSFVPYQGDDDRYNDMQNEVYYYNGDSKRDGNKEVV